VIVLLCVPRLYWSRFFVTLDPIDIDYKLLQLQWDLSSKYLKFVIPPAWSSADGLRSKCNRCGSSWKQALCYIVR